MELLRITFPKEIQQTENLYFRLFPEDNDFTDGCMENGTVFSTDTYYNLFSLSKYQKYTDLRNLSLNLQAEGMFFLSIYQQSYDRPNINKIIVSQEIYFIKGEEICIPIKSIDFMENTIIYFTLRACGKECRFHSGYYATQAVENKIKLAMIICTYRREGYVYHRIDSLCQNIFDNPKSDISKNIELYVIDNGKTIEQSWKGDLPIYLIQNKNLGGSGGFARGMLEVLKRREEFTHILLTDDDIVLDYHVLLKTIQFFKILRKEYMGICLAGSMLYIEHPTVQHEAGAIWDKKHYRLCPSKGKLDLSKKENLLLNEKENILDYAGWGYFCMPVKVLRDDNLPLPFFVKFDDVEYAIRNQLNCITMNGIGFWHPSGKNNYSPALEYYELRNQLVLNACHKFPNHFFRLGIGKKYLIHVIYHNWGVVSCILNAVDDYLSGVGFFRTVDSEEKHKWINLKFVGEIHERHVLKQKILLSVKALFQISFWKAIKEYIKLIIHFCIKHKKVDWEYQKHYHEICSAAFWKELFEEGKHEEV